MIKEALWMGWDWMVIIGRRKSKNTFGANKIGCRSIMYTILEEEPGDFEPGQLNCHLVRLAAVVN